MGRHALLEAPDAPVVTPADTAAAPGSEVRSVAEIIAEFRREQGLAALPSRRARTAEVVAETATPVDDDSTHDVVVGPWTTAALSPSDEDDDHDDARDDDPTTGPHGGGSHDTGEIAAVRERREAAWHAALRPAGTPPPTRRRRAASGSNASAVIASLTAELAGSHPGLLEGTPHSRRAEPAAKRTTASGSAASLRPVRVGGGLRGAALRVPALAGGWRLPTRTPLVLAGVVAVSVVVTDQAGLLSSTEAGAAATAASQQRDLAATAQANEAAATQAASDDAAAEGARQARARVSRLERSPLPKTADSAATQSATPTSAGTAVGAAPPPDSVMKPGQTVPGDWVRPSAKGIYNSCFCSRWGTMHEGIDFAAPLGSPILAVGDGVVVQAGPASGFGNWVIIQHENGDMTIYGHMRYYFVKIGQHVKAGQEIALVGAEGQSTGPHLHLGVKIGSTTGHDGTYVDPVPWLKARGIDVGTYNVNG